MTTNDEPIALNDLILSYMYVDSLSLTDLIAMREIMISNVEVINDVIQRRTTDRIHFDKVVIRNDRE